MQENIPAMNYKLSAMNFKFSALLLLGLLLGCKNSAIEPYEVSASDEVAASVVGYLFADNWNKSCDGGGLVTVINAETFVARNLGPDAYEDKSGMSYPVWIRYERASPDTCNQSTNLIKILSIRERK